MAGSAGWKWMLVCTAGLLLFAVGFFSGRCSGGTVVTETPVVLQSSVQEAAVPATAVPADETETVNINTADEALLETLPGIGPVLAQRIVEYRQTHGPFRTIDQIKDVKGIGTQTFAELAGYISIGDDT